MSFPPHYEMFDNFGISSVFTGLEELTSPLVGNKWYQSWRSSEMDNMDLVNDIPWNQLPSPHQASNPNFSQLAEYTPPTHVSHHIEPPLPPPLSLPHFYTLPSTLNLHTTLSTGQPYYALASTTPATPTSAIADSPKLMDNPHLTNIPMITAAANDEVDQWEDKLTQMIAIIEKMQDNFSNRSNVNDKKAQGKSKEVDEGTLQHQLEDVSTKFVSPFPQIDSAVIVELDDLSKLGTKNSESSEQLQLPLPMSVCKVFDESSERGYVFDTTLATTYATKSMTIHAELNLRALKPNSTFELAKNDMTTYKLHENEYGKVQGLPNIMLKSEVEFFHHRVFAFLSTCTAYEFLPDSWNVFAFDVGVTLFTSSELIQLLKPENGAYVLATYEADTLTTILAVRKLVGAIIVENLILMPLFGLEIISDIDTKG
ncbi:hypothetical protein ACET3Z_009441 [Daucus carota]